MNEHSSRSHTILTVHIHSEEKASNEENNVRHPDFYIIVLIIYTNSTTLVIKYNDVTFL